MLAWAVSLETLQNQRESAKMEPKKGASEGQVEGQPAATNGKKDGHSSGENVELVASGGHFSNNYDANGMRRVLSATNGSGGFWMEDITVKGLRAPIPGLEEHGPAGANRVANTQPLTLGTLFNPLSAAAYALGVLSALLDTAVKLCLEVHNQLREALHGASRDALPAPHSADLAIKSGKSLDVGDEVPSAPMAVSEASLGYGLAMLRRSGAAPRATISPENQYEKQLLAEVLTPETLGGGFRDVGALDEAKRALREAVQLPLQRPELFEAGALASPAKGVLLFGPPGTGKTLLARAAAAESGASFLELSLSSVASKWFGDSTRLVRAAFSLAAKLAPCVLFIDEVDALLGRRSSGGREHEAMREMKNEFMARWDGIRGEGGRRVLVLGATNRPFDLDEAVLRRFTARVSVGLPGKKARKDILDVILAGQALDEGVDIEAVADRCEGFSGADLKQLCMAAAMRPVRELLEVPASDDACLSAHPTMKLPEEGSPSHEKDAGSKELALPRMVLCALRDAAQVGASGGVGAKAPRPVSAADFDAVLQEVRPTVDPDSGVIQELKEWDQKFGSMGRRGEGRALSYFT